MIGIGMEVTSFDIAPPKSVCKLFPSLTYAIFTTPKVPLPSFEQFTSSNYFEQSGSSAYLYSGMMVKYTIDKYGVDVLNKIIRKPDQIEKTLDTSFRTVYEEWNAELTRKN